MNRRAFLLGSASALEAPIPAPAIIVATDYETGREIAWRENEKPPEEYSSLHPYSRIERRNLPLMQENAR